MEEMGFVHFPTVFGFVTFTATLIGTAIVIVNAPLKGNAELAVGVVGFILAGLLAYLVAAKGSDRQGAATLLLMIGAAIAAYVLRGHWGIAAGAVGIPGLALAVWMLFFKDSDPATPPPDPGGGRA